jgi:hypothetical protein
MEERDLLSPLGLALVPLLVRNLVRADRARLVAGKAGGATVPAAHLIRGCIGCDWSADDVLKLFLRRDCAALRPADDGAAAAFRHAAVWVADMVLF